MNYLAQFLLEIATGTSSAIGAGIGGVLGGTVSLADSIRRKNKEMMNCQKMKDPEQIAICKRQVIEKYSKGKSITKGVVAGAVGGAIVGGASAKFMNKTENPQENKNPNLNNNENKDQSRQQLIDKKNDIKFKVEDLNKQKFELRNEYLKNIKDIKKKYNEQKMKNPTDKSYDPEKDKYIRDAQNKELTDIKNDYVEKLKKVDQDIKDARSGKIE